MIIDRLNCVCENICIECGMLDNVIFSGIVILCLIFLVVWFGCSDIMVIWVLDIFGKVFIGSMWNVVILV